MNREIKFRAYNSKTKEMLIQGNAQDENRSLFWHLWETTSHMSAPMQYSGLKDRNGVEIYEGDIVNFAVKKKICPICSAKEIHSELRIGISKFCPDCGTKVENSDFVEKAEIVFSNGGFVFEYNKTEFSIQNWQTFISECYIEWKEVIGNIHNLNR